MLTMVVVRRGKLSYTVLIILEHPELRRMQCVQEPSAFCTLRCNKNPLKAPDSHVVERPRFLQQHGLGLSSLFATSVY